MKFGSPADTIDKSCLTLNLLPPFPKAYLNARIHEIASGTCVNEFRWNAGRSHVANRKWNRNDFPTDSNILCYLFCVYLSHPGWRFEGDFRKANPRTSFFVGALPHKPGEHSRAILPQTAVTKTKGHIILFQSRFGDPLYTLVTEGEEIRFSGHSGVFRGLAEEVGFLGVNLCGEGGIFHFEVGGVGFVRDGAG